MLLYVCGPFMLSFFFFHLTAEISDHFSTKGQIANNFGFVGCVGSVTTIP